MTNQRFETLRRMTYYPKRVLELGHEIITEQLYKIKKYNLVKKRQTSIPNFMSRFNTSISGRGALYKRRSQSESNSGANTRENAGMSSEKGCENHPRRNPKDS